MPSIEIRKINTDSSGIIQKYAYLWYSIKDIPLNTINSATVRWTRKPPAVDWPTDWTPLSTTIFSTIQKNAYPGRTDFNAAVPLYMPANGYYYISIRITTTRGEVYDATSAELNLAFTPKPLQNLQVVKNNNLITLSWNAPSVTYGYLPIYAYRIDCKIDDIIYTINTPNGIGDFTGFGNASSYTINLDTSPLPKNKIYYFRLTVYDTAYQYAERWFPKIFVGNNNTNNQLFDKSSWATAAPAVKKYLDIAADMWANYIKFDSNILPYILKMKPNFKGIKLNSIKYIYDMFKAQAGGAPSEFIDIGTNQDTKFNTLSFNLVINRYYLDIGYQGQDVDPYWVKVFIHELGHALGIGVYWHYWSGNIHTLNDQWVNSRSQLDGKYFPNTQNAYIEINKYRKKGWKRGFIPLNFDGQGKDQHWAHIRNPLNKYTYAHPPMPEDIMSYGWGAANISQLALIGLVTIKNLVDFGYAEVNPGSFEEPAQPLTQSLSSSILSEETFECIGTLSDEYEPVKVGSINLITKEINYAIDTIIPVLESDETTTTPTPTPTPIITPTP
jgi:hypothetical protein